MILALKTLGFSAAVVMVFLANSTFSNTITTGTVLVAVLIVIVFGFFSFVNRRRDLQLRDNAGWRDLYEQERAKNDLANDKIAAITEAKEQERILKHKAKDDLAGLKAQLEVERMKPDLSQVLAKQQEQHTETIKEITTLVTRVATTQERTIALLEKLDGKLDVATTDAIQRKA